MSANGNQRIANHTAVLMIAVAALFDMLQFLFFFIPGVNVLLGWLINLFALMTFGLWFLIHGKIFSRRPWQKIGLGAGAAFIEMIVGFLPTWIFYVAATIWMTRREDAEDAEKATEEAAQLRGSFRKTKRGAAATGGRRVKTT